MPTQSVNLTNHQSTFIGDMLAGGHYKDASEVLRAGLRLLESHEEEERLRLERLRAEVQKGMDDLAHGRATTVSTREELSAFFGEIRSECKEHVAQEDTDGVATKVQ